MCNMLWIALKQYATGNTGEMLATREYWGKTNGSIFPEKTKGVKEFLAVITNACSFGEGYIFNT